MDFNALKMKKLLSIFFALLFGISGLFAANRYANSTDVSTYSPSTFGQLQLNDYIWDTPFSTSGGYGQIYVTNIATQFASLRVGGTIWFDAAALPDLYSVYMTNEANGGAAWQPAGSTTGDVIRLRPLGGQIKTVATSASSTARLWLIADFIQLEINGYVPTFTGMKHDWSGQLMGSFGFTWDGGTVLSDDTFQIMIDGSSGIQSIALYNLDIAHGFCALRIVPGNTDISNVSFRAERLYLHDSIEGEMFYVGQTTGTPFVKWENVTIKDVICARSAAEAIQLQHLLSTAGRAYQENFVIYASADLWKAPFQPFQDNGFQWVVDEGRNVMRNGIIDGSANSPISVISSSVGTPDSDPAVIENVLINDTRDLGIYIGASVNQGVSWEYRNVYFNNANNTYNELTEATVSQYFISYNGSDKSSFINMTWDNSKPNLFEDETGLEIFGTVQDNAMSNPEYRNHGFPDRIAEQIEIYNESYTLAPRVGDKIDYNLDDIGIRWLPGTSYRFYNCILAHTSSGSTHPESDPTHWELIQWDEEGDPSYDAAWDSGDSQSYYPPDDFRLVSNTTWNLEGMGLSSNERNTNYTYFQWMIDDNGDDSGNLELAGKTDPNELEIFAEDRGRYVRCKAYVKLPGGGISTAWLGDWVQVN